MLFHSFRLVLAATALMALALGGCGDAGSDAGAGSTLDTATGSEPVNSGEDNATQTAGTGDTTALRLGHVFPEDNGWHEAANNFAQYVTEATDGQVTVDVFPNSQLGTEREIFEGLGLGTIDMAFGGPGVLTGFFPKVGLLDQPFLFDSYEHANAVMDGEIGQQLWDEMAAEAGIRVLASGSQGFRYVLTKGAEVKGLDDMSGLKIRVPEAETFLDTFNALGANPTPVAYEETYLAIETGTVDGFEGVPTIITSSKMYEVAKNLAETRHILATLQLMISEDVFQDLSADHQQAISEAAVRAWTEQREQAQVQNNEALNALQEEHGVQLTQPDLTEFQAAVEPIWDEWASENDATELLQAAQAAS